MHDIITRRFIAIAAAIGVIITGGVVVALAVTNTQSTTNSAGSGSSNVSSCDTDYKVTLATPTYDATVGDYVIATASTDTLEDKCAGQTVVMKVLNNSGVVIASGSAQPSNATKIATVTFDTPAPVGTTYKVKTLIYG